MTSTNIHSLHDDDAWRIHVTEDPSRIHIAVGNVSIFMSREEAERLADRIKELPGGMNE